MPAEAKGPGVVPPEAVTGRERSTMTPESRDTQAAAVTTLNRRWEEAVRRGWDAAKVEIGSPEDDAVARRIASSLDVGDLSSESIAHDAKELTGSDNKPIEYNHQPIKGILFPDKDGKVGGKDVGEPLHLNLPTGTGRLMAITERNGDTYTVWVENEDGSRHRVEGVPCQQVLFANMVAEGPEMLKALEGDRDTHDVVQAYLDDIDATKAEADKSTVRPEQLKKVAGDLGMMTGDEATELADVLGVSGNDAVSSALQGRTVLAAKEVTAIFASDRASRDRIITQNMSISDNLSQLQGELDELPSGAELDALDDNDPKKVRQAELTQQIQDAQRQQKILQKVEGNFEDNVTAKEARGQVNSVIAVRMQEVSKELQPLLESQKKGETVDPEKLAKLQLEQAQLEFAQKAAAGEAGVILQNGILNQVLEQGGSVAIDRTINDPAVQAEIIAASTELGGKLKGAGLEQTDVDTVINAFKNPALLPELFENHTLMGKIEPLLIGEFFGEGANKAEAYNSFDKLAKAYDNVLATLPEDNSFRKRIANFVRDPKKMSMLALILAAFPLVVTTIAATTAVGMVGQAANRR